MKRLFTATLAAVALVAACNPGAVVPPPAPSALSAAASQDAGSSSAASLDPSPVPAASLAFTPGTKASPRAVKITTDDKLTFFPNVITVAQGETVAFAITNTGKAAHEFMLGAAADAIADKEGTPEVADIKAGGTATLAFTFDGSGPYAFACHEPGHFEAGMVGYVIVVGPDVPTVGTLATPRLVEVDMDDQLTFTPDQHTVAKGETVTFLLTNLGTATHEFAVGPKDKVDADQLDGTLVKEADGIAGHQVKTLTYTFDGPRPYGFACHEPGHFEAGMKGTIALTN